MQFYIERAVCVTAPSFVAPVVLRLALLYTDRLLGVEFSDIWYILWSTSKN